MNGLRALQIRAFRAVEKPTYPDFLERVRRWYSRTFSTPLAEVDDIPDDDLLFIWFVELYANMDENQLHDEKVKLSKTEAEARAEAEQAAAEEVEFEETARIVAEEALREKKKRELRKASEKKLADIEEALSKNIIFDGLDEQDKAPPQKKKGPKPPSNPAAEIEADLAAYALLDTMK